MLSYHHVVIGGGIAGTCVAAELSRLSLAPGRRHAAAAAAVPPSTEPVASPHILLITASSSVKWASIHDAGDGRVSRLQLAEFDVEEKHAAWLSEHHPGVDVRVDEVVSVDVASKRIRCRSGAVIAFYKLCICAGAVPRTITQHPRVIGLRDTHTVTELARMLTGARRVVIVGNGGIALGLVHHLQGVELAWIVRDAYIGNTFFDASASAFFLSSTDMAARVVLHANSASQVVDWHRDEPLVQPSHSSGDTAQEEVGEVVRMYEPLPRRERKRPRKDDGRATAPTVNTSTAAVTATAPPMGSCLGPGWLLALDRIAGGVPAPPALAHPHPLHVYTQTHVLDITPLDGDAWPLRVNLSSGESVDCDFVVSATGVTPHVPFVTTLASTAISPSALAEWVASTSAAPFRAGDEFITSALDGGLLVNRRMQTSASPDIHAAGDCACVTWPRALARGATEVCMWFQMRLWSQARAQAVYAARCMADALHELEADDGGVAFEVFAHSTSLLGFKTTLLGLFNGQGMDDAYTAALTRAVLATTHGATSSVHGAHVAATSEDAAQSGDTGQRELQVLFRVTPGVEYVKVVVHRGRVIGAMLIGDTDMEETMENLILNRLDLRRSDSDALLDILNPEVDIEDYFD